MPADADAFETLARAIHAGDTTTVGALLERHPELGPRLNEPLPDGHFGARVFSLAVGQGNREMIDVLIWHGADINARSNWWAGSFGVLDTCDPALAPFLLDRGARIDAHSAARLGMLDTLRQLVAADPSLVHARGGDGQTPLHFASTVEIARFLLDIGADIDAKDVDHESTPAQWMVRDRPDVARFLVTRGCRSDILMASALGAADLVRRHLDQNPESIHTRVSTEYFPMRDARAGGSMYIWTIGKFKTAHVIARENGHEDIFADLMERSPNLLKLGVAVDVGDEQLVRAVLDFAPGALQDLQRSEPRKLVDAAEQGNARGVRLLLDAGWPVDARGSDNQTALHFASWTGDADLARDLLALGAPTDIVEREHGGTPLDWALYGSRHCGDRSANHAGVVQAMLEAGVALPAPLEGINASESVREVITRHTRGLS